MHNELRLETLYTMHDVQGTEFVVEDGEITGVINDGECVSED